jgi:dCMP deaminase
MKTAETFGSLSTAKRLQVGSIIVKDNRIISIGYNGMPSGWDNCCEKEVVTEYESYTDSQLVTKPEVIHAEANAIAKLAKSHESGLDAEMYITHAPCIDCAKMIYTAGIKTVYYKNYYRSCDGIVFLAQCGVTTVHFTEE